MPLPKTLTTVTSLSKVISAVLFVVIPLIAFLLGMQYQEMAKTLIQ